VSASVVAELSDAGVTPSSGTQFAFNGDGVRTSKTVSGDTTEYVLDLAATLPVVAVHCPPDESSGSPGLCMAWARLGFTP
jgi:hypothetical protein